MPNAQFYGGRLIDGCTREQRASLLPGLPSLVLLDVRGQEQYSAGTEQHSTEREQDWVACKCIACRHWSSGLLLQECVARDTLSIGLQIITLLTAALTLLHFAGRSASNQAEAEAVVAAVERLAAAGVSLGQIGVICIYRAQASAVRPCANGWSHVRAVCGGM